MRRSETAAELQNASTSDDVPRIVASMIRGESGFEPFVDYEGRRMRLTYAPIGHADWSIAILYPEDELLSDARRTFTLQLILLLAGLTLLVGVVVLLSRRLTRPIKELSSSAGRIAAGDLDAELPMPRSGDEIGALTQSFRDMRDSLKNYIAEIESTARARQKLESELQISHNIQMDMLPKEDLGGDTAGFDLSATLLPARQVGGDLFYHFVNEEGQVAFLVGDVSGKGIPASLFMARTKTLFETIASTADSVGGALGIVNRSLAAENDAGMFVTVFAGVFDPQTGVLRCASGGHDAPVLIPGDGSEPHELEIDGGPLIGILNAAEFPTNTLTLAKGDAIVSTTDGVPEARNVDGDFFELDRFLDTVRGMQSYSAKAVTIKLLTAVQKFAKGAEQSDDITILTLKYKG